MTITLHEDFQYCLDELNPSGNGLKLTDEQITRLEKIFPQSLMDFLKLHGFESFHDGLFQMCDPKIMRQILAMVFNGDKNFNHKDCHVIGFTAFGELICWSDEFWDVRVNLPETSIYATSLTHPEWEIKTTANDYVSSTILSAESADFLDIMGNPMYAACQKAHGNLAPGECYGFFPALAISGVLGPLRRVENVKRVNALEHFAILAQMETFHLMSVGGGKVVPFRPIG